MASPTEISVQQLSRLIGTPDCPLLLDVRLDEDFDASPSLLPGSRRVPFDQMSAVLSLCQDRSVVVICHKGLKLSQGAAAELRCRGVQAETLRGGYVAWSEASLPLVSTAPIAALAQGERSIWVTRQRPKIDRIACPWLIRRFVDPQADFLFVASSQVEAVAERFDAIPFDIEDTFWSHRGDNCTFDTLLQELQLRSEALDRLALIVRGADTENHALAPESAGLLAASLGLSRMYKDDLAQLEAGIALYDAFYRWARDATDEGHDWPASNNKKA